MFLSYNDGTLRMMWDGPPSLSTEHVGYDGLLGDGNGDAGGIGAGGKPERLGLGEGGVLSNPGETMALLCIVSVLVLFRVYSMPCTFCCRVSPILTLRVGV